MKKILDQHASNLALIIGNGINHFGASQEINSWDKLLLELSKTHFPDYQRKIPEGVSLTEFYDVMELQLSASISSISLQQQFCDYMSDWSPLNHHKMILRWALNNNAPVLTTNFDRVFADAIDCELHRTIKGKFTAYYPWESYYGKNIIVNPSQEFGIWHINGMAKYRQSIRLGLSHYMGSVQRARGWLHRGEEKRLFSGEDSEQWYGSKTWLHIIFNTPLLIFGIALEENEVFLRWLLIERARYFKKFPKRKQPAWYVHTSDTDSHGKIFFLKGVGVEPIKVDNYDDIYGEHIWE